MKNGRMESIMGMMPGAAKMAKQASKQVWMIRYLSVKLPY